MKKWGTYTLHRAALLLQKNVSYRMWFPMYSTQK